MISSARLAVAALALCLAGPSGAAGQGEGGAVPAPLAGAVRGAVASVWQADSARVQLSWGAVPGAAELAADTPFRLVGKGDDGWFVVVFEPRGSSPAAVRVRAGTDDTVRVAARPLANGVTLAEADLRTEVRTSWGAPADGGERPGPGWLTRRPLAAGDPLTPATALPPQVVQAGDAVQLEWERGSVRVALEGVALNPAALGQPVRVRLAGRGGQRSGRATGPGAVRLDS